MYIVLALCFRLLSPAIYPGSILCVCVCVWNVHPCVCAYAHLCSLSLISGNTETECNIYEESAMQCKFPKDISFTKTNFAVYYQSSNGKKGIFSIYSVLASFCVFIYVFQNLFRQIVLFLIVVDKNSLMSSRSLLRANKSSFWRLGILANFVFETY